MLLASHRPALPSNEEYSVPQLRMMIRQVEQILGRSINAEEWSRLQESQRSNRPDRGPQRRGRNRPQREHPVRNFELPRGIMGFRT